MMYGAQQSFKRLRKVKKMGCIPTKIYAVNESDWPETIRTQIC
jgi:hypothetical protein